MAEVSQRLSNGAHGLSTLLQTRCRPVLPIRGASLSSSCKPTGAGASGGAAGSAEGLCENKPVSKIKTTADRHSQTRKCLGIKHGTKNRPRWGLIPLGPGVYPFVELIQNSQVHKTALHVSPGVQPVLRVGLLVGRMTFWSNNGYVVAAAVRSETFTSPQHLREFSTLVLSFAQRGDSTGLPGNTFRPQRVKHRLHILELRNITRGYSSNPTKEAGPLYRSRTAYYDLLKVSPHATQSQIKTAYYKQSFIFHPDKNQGDETAGRRFTEVSEAYTVLGNIGLRRKYDRGILGPSDVHSAGRPSSKEAPGRPPGPQHQQQQQPRHSAQQQQYSRVGGRPMFDFDAFYRAHYGEQLEREQRARARKEWLEERRRQSLEKWKRSKMMELTVGVLLAIGGLILIQVR